VRWPIEPSPGRLAPWQRLSSQLVQPNGHGRRRALGTGIAWLVWIAINLRTHGGLDDERRWFGVFTLVLAAFTAWDAVLTALVSVPFALYVTSAPKLPLSIVWDFWLAWDLPRSRH
jgi:hypothetical protein